MLEIFQNNVLKIRELRGVMKNHGNCATILEDYLPRSTEVV
jgi:hypothetical protein